MRIFDRDRKTNFVDDNNVLVGFDSGQCCCENFGYFFTEEMPDFSTCEEAMNTPDTEGFQFDANFLLRQGEFAVFKLNHANGKSLYLTLFNHHNGYYTHGFEMRVGNTVTIEGGI